MKERNLLCTFTSKPYSQPSAYLIFQQAQLESNWRHRSGLPAGVRWCRDVFDHGHDTLKLLNVTTLASGDTRSVLVGQAGSMWTCVRFCFVPLSNYFCRMDNRCIFYWTSELTMASFCLGQQACPLFSSAQLKADEYYLGSSSASIALLCDMILFSESRGLNSQFQVGLQHSRHCQKIGLSSCLRLPSTQKEGCPHHSVGVVLAGFRICWGTYLHHDRVRVYYNETAGKSLAFSTFIGLMTFRVDARLPGATGYFLGGNLPHHS